MASHAFKIISGGQTGADQGGLWGARAAGIETGGTAPKDWRTEDGPAPWLAAFGLIAGQSRTYAARSQANVEAADGTVIFGAPLGPGSALTARLCRTHGKPCLVIPCGRARLHPDRAARRLARWIAENGIATLNVAGNRESQTPGIEDFVRDAVAIALTTTAPPPPTAAAPRKRD